MPCSCGTCSCSRSDRNGKRRSGASRAADDVYATRSVAMENVNLDFWALIQQGAISTYPLIACSIIVVALAFERAWALRGAIATANATVPQIAPALARGDVPGAQGVLAKLPA